MEEKEMAEKYFDEETWKWVIKDIKGLSMKMITVMMTTTLFMTTLTGCSQKSSAFFVEDNPIINEARADGREDEVYELRNAIQAEYEADMKKRAQKEADEAAQAVDPHPEWLLETTDMHIGSRESDGIGYGLIVPIPNKFIEYTEAQGEVYHSRKSREDVVPGFKSVKYKDVTWQSNMDGIKEIQIECRHDGAYDVDNELFKGVYSKEDTASIWRLMVDKDYRRHGIARKLVCVMEEFARNAGYDKIYLHTHRYLESGIPFWTSAGYEITIEEDDYDETTHMVKYLSQ
jgi:ribosomal protein S18 acetylase RimI-like enzyme